ncbi:LysR family transcriptional regulator [Parasedimentitalea marina]|uniref:LysR family transcriptional regulator n=1 Tax=Parasedimentitalea marina TaxID=2483033 RepID=A0A3T0MZ53_9RHOB|nr:LysR family transcriptional regulator [Parasedimentitalea marina]AZV77048.1 LysR family transcriptional regulator [Parasedimentitalea marina]
MSHSPSLTALRAFDLVARLGSFTEAARKQNVTRPAISKQVKGLEVLMGCQLIVRSGPKVTLTTQGTELAAGLRQGFDIISASTQKVIEHSNHPKTVRILVERDFASSWLAERIGAFLVAHPGISIEVNAEHNGQLREGEDFSFRIFYGPKGCYETETLVEDFLCDWVDIPVCTPDYQVAHITEHGRYHNAHFLIDKNYNPWSEWFDKADLENPGAQASYTSFNETTLCLSAALAGSGITIGDSFLCLPAIDSGRLVAPFKIGLRSSERYSICYPSGRTLSKSERYFQNWLTQTIKEYDQTVGQVLSGIGINVIASHT